ncbi:MAG: caspase domain-containing protein, partial [Xenococcus sp. (in: cyanobacteria)]
MPAGIITYRRDRINNTYGLFVGIDEYPLSPRLNLRGCVRDARNMCRVFDTNNSKLIINEQATRKNILGAIQYYIKNLKSREFLIITISAHGTIVNNDMAIIPSDVEEDNMLGTVLSMFYFINALSQIAKNGGKVLLLLDACGAGAIPFDIAKYSGILSAQGGISSISSCGAGEYSSEAEFDGEQQGVFTKYLIEGLDGGADFDKLDIITLRDLYFPLLTSTCSFIKVCT